MGRKLLKSVLSVSFAIGVAWIAYLVLRPPAGNEWKLNAINTAVLTLVFSVAKDLAETATDEVVTWRSRRRVAGYLRTAIADLAAEKPTPLPLRALLSPDLGTSLFGDIPETDARIVAVEALQDILHKNAAELKQHASDIDPIERRKILKLMRDLSEKT